jgi:hypothetical protein
MNDPTYVESSRKLAERILNEGGDSPEAKLTFAVRTMLSRAPSEKELAILKRLLERERDAFKAKPEEAKKLLAVGESPRDEKLDTVELAAWTVVASTLLNLDETMTKN